MKLRGSEMYMPRFFSNRCSNDRCYINGADAVHIAKSLRMKIGDELLVCDKNGTDYHCEIESLDLDEIILKVSKKEPTKTEPNVKVTLYMALPKSDKMELIIQKCVELGIFKIVPVITSRCISRPDDKSMHKKIERYQKIAYEAAKQSGRGIIPEISERLSFREALKMASKNDSSMIFYENGGDNIESFLTSKPKTIALFVGAEGGFDIEEISLAKEFGVLSATLGPRILRCETAPISATSIIMYLTGNM